MTRHPDLFVAESLRQSAEALSSRERAELLRRLVSLIDLTSLDADATDAHIEALCRTAVRPVRGRLDPPLRHVAAVVVHCSKVRVAAGALAGTPVRVACVTSAFPSGQLPIETRVADVRRAIADGADEIDVVIDRRALLAGDEAKVVDDVRRLREACGGAPIKIILETGELGALPRVRRAATLAIEAAERAGPIRDGDVFLKTSTGTMSPGATLSPTLVIADVARAYFAERGVRLGIKPAGGIRVAADALRFLLLVKESLGEDWIDPRLMRVGASRLIDDVERELGR